MHDTTTARTSPARRCPASFLFLALGPVGPVAALPAELTGFEEQFARVAVNGPRHALQIRAGCQFAQHLAFEGVAGLALRHGVNANLLRHWMKLEHWPGQVPALLPVTIATEPACREAATATRAYPSSGTMEIELCGAVVRLSGEIDVAQLKTVLAVLRS